MLVLSLMVVMLIALVGVIANVSFRTVTRLGRRIGKTIMAVASIYGFCDAYTSIFGHVASFFEMILNLFN